MQSDVGSPTLLLCTQVVSSLSLHSRCVVSRRDIISDITRTARMEHM